MARQRLQLEGQRFGMLTVLKFSHIDPKNKGSYWLCRCDCGTEKVLSGHNLRAGLVTDCGCTWRSRVTTHNSTRTRLYKAWANMKARCYNPNNNRYHRYGGRGITVCDEWKNDFEAFQQWALSNGYRDDLTIERINNNKGYSPKNCRWATHKEQGNNKSTNTIITYMGETHTLAEWAEKLGIDYHTLLSRYHYKKWSIKDTLMTPVRDSERLLELNGEVHNMADWGRITGFGKEAIRSRLRMGWSVEDALTKPVNENIRAANCHRKSYTYKGFTGTLKALSKHLGLSYSMLQCRLFRGWDLEAAIETPPSDGHHPRRKNSRLTQVAI